MTVKDSYTMFQPGTRIMIVNNTSYKNGNFVGERGIVKENRTANYGTVAVKLDNVTNPRSGRGVFYFKPHDLKVIVDCKAVTDYISMARIRFLDGNDTETLSSDIVACANYDPSIKAGDVCVITTSPGFRLAKIIDFIDMPPIPLTREIVAKVDTYDYDLRVAKRKETVDVLLKHKKHLLEKIERLDNIISDIV